MDDQKIIQSIINMANDYGYYDGYIRVPESVKRYRYLLEFVKSEIRKSFFMAKADTYNDFRKVVHKDDSC